MTQLVVDAIEDGPSNDRIIQRFQLLVWLAGHDRIDDHEDMIEAFDASRRSTSDKMTNLEGRHQRLRPGEYDHSSISLTMNTYGHVSLALRPVQTS